MRICSQGLSNDTCASLNGSAVRSDAAERKRYPRNGRNGAVIDHAGYGDLVQSTRKNHIRVAIDFVGEADRKVFGREAVEVNSTKVI